MRAGLVVRQIHHWTAVVFLAAIVAAPVPHLLHRRVPPAPRDQLDHRRDDADPRDLQRLRRLLAPRRPAVAAPGLRIAYSILLSIPFVGTWLAFLFFGGEYPGPRHHRPPVHHPRADPPGADRRAARRPPRDRLAPEAHAVPRAGAHRAQRRRVRGCGRLRGASRAGLFAAVVAVVAALGGLAQINPIWLYGPYRTGAVTTAAQPDWYMGWLEGALRLFPAVARAHLRPHHLRDVLARRRAARPHVRAAVRVAVPRSAASRATTPSTTCSTGPATDRCAPRSASACSPSTSCCSWPARRTSSPNTRTPASPPSPPSCASCWWSARPHRLAHLEDVPRPPRR